MVFVDQNACYIVLLLSTRSIYKHLCDVIQLISFGIQNTNILCRNKNNEISHGKYINSIRVKISIL